MIDKFIQTLCCILKIPKPVISYDTSIFPSVQVKAMYIHNKNTIYLAQFEKPDFEILFSITHELRHAWQFQNNPIFYFGNYHGLNECSNLDEYNNQAAEIDANAFGELILNSFFHVSPQYYSLSEYSRQQIHKRAKEIMISLTQK